MTATPQQSTKTGCTCAKADWDLHPNANRTIENYGADKIRSQHSCAKTQEESKQMQAKQMEAMQKKDSKECAGKGCSSCCCGKQEWDLHPATIRHIENQGSDAQVKELHDLEHKCSRGQAQAEAL